METAAEFFVHRNVRHERAVVLPVHVRRLYWADGSGIRRANLDGSGLQTLVSGLPGASGLALDLTNSKMYWTDLMGGGIERANLDGSGRETVVTGLSDPALITIESRVAPVPEAGTFLLFCIGLLGWASYAWLRSEP